MKEKEELSIKYLYVAIFDGDRHENNEKGDEVPQANAPIVGCQIDGECPSVDVDLMRHAYEYERGQEHVHH